MSKISKEHFEDGLEKWFASEDEFYPFVRMQNAKTFLGSASIRIAPHHVG